MASSSTANDKPLPSPPVDPPTPKQLTSLSVESRAHLRLFVKHALAEENVEGAAAWLKGLELGLREMCDAMARGAWLAGIKGARKAQHLRRWREERQRKQRECEKGDLTKTGEKSRSKDYKEKENVKVEGLAPTNAKNTPQTFIDAEHSQESRRRLALTQLSSISSSPKTPSPGHFPSHLLLTLSPKNATLPPQDIELDIVPSNKMCIFTANKFMLPSADDWKRGTGGIVLYGLDEWDGEFTETIMHIRHSVIALLQLTTAKQARRHCKLLAAPFLSLDCLRRRNFIL